jgi:hypothetical protein
MAHTYLVYIYDHELRRAQRSEEKWKDLCPEIGDAVLTVCVDPETTMEPEDGVLREVRKTSHKVGNNSNAVNFCDKVHAGQLEVYGWAGNRLASIEDLHDDELRDVSEKVSEEMRRRGLKNGSSPGGQSPEREDQA